MRLILVTTTEKQIVQTIRSCFKSDYRVDNTTTKHQALDLLSKKRYDLVFIELDILLADASDENYKESLQPFWKILPSIEIIVMASHRNIRKAVRAVKAGASDYLPYPIDPEEVKHIAESVTESIMKQSELDYLRDQFWDVDSLELVRTKSRTMKKVFDNIRSVSPTKSSVLLIGDTGTGKSVLAKLIHQHSNRRDAQFISVHCGAIPDTLVESEMFGHEKGAFTGAIKRKLGKFEIAKGGTIFLDEIGTITPSSLLTVAGTAECDVLEINGGSDIAEPFDIRDTNGIKTGMVMSIDGDHPGKLKLSEKAYDRCVAGIISGAGGINPGMIMGQSGSVADGEFPVALTGRVYCCSEPHCHFRPDWSRLRSLAIELGTQLGEPITIRLHGVVEAGSSFTSTVEVGGPRKNHAYEFDAVFPEHAPDGS